MPVLAVGLDTLCGEVGLLSLLSNEFAGRNSGDLDAAFAVEVDVLISCCEREFGLVSVCD